MNDERLARKAAAGDERAFAAIFRRYQQDLYRYCLAIVGNSADAQDALQNTMVKALRALPGERREIALKPWLYRVAHNESVDLLRQRRTEPLNPEAAAPGAGLAETAASRQRLRDLIADLGRLPERQRGALVMRELSDLDFEQIGSALGTSAATARQTVYEARQGLRQMEAGREMRCETVTRALSDGDGRTLRRRDVRAHLHACADCRAFRAGIEQRRGDLAALSPLPAVAAAAILKGALGVAGGGAAGAAAGGGAVAGTLGAAGGIGVAAKATATVAAVAAIGIGAADRTGLVDVTGSGGDNAAKTAPAAADGGEPGRAQVTAPASGAASGLDASQSAAPPSGSPRPAGGDGGGGGGSSGGHDTPPASPNATAQGGNGQPAGQGSEGKARGHEKDHPNGGGNNGAPAKSPPGQGKAKSSPKGQAVKETKKANAPTGKDQSKQGSSTQTDRGHAESPPKTPPGQTAKDEAAASPPPPDSQAPPETKAATPPSADKEQPGRRPPEEGSESSP